jgi:hypothetical protein
MPLAFLFVLLVDPRTPKEGGRHWDLQMMTELDAVCGREVSSNLSFGDFRQCPAAAFN